MENWGLTKEDIGRINRIFSKFNRIEKVLIYGSRAMGNYKPASDIDLTLVGKNIDLDLQLEIEFQLDDLMLPYKFDISIYDQLTNPDFKNHINRNGKEFYRKNHQRENKPS